MRARLTRFEARPGSGSELAQRYRASVLSLGQALPGMRRMVLMLNEATQAGLCMSLWEGEPGLPVPEQAPTFAQLLAGQEQPTSYDVSAWIRAGGGPTRAAVTVSRARPGQLDAAVAVMREIVLPTTEIQPGFSGASVFTDAASGALISATAWRAEADMEVFAATPAARHQLTMLQPLLAEPIDLWVYTILVMY